MSSRSLRSVPNRSPVVVDGPRTHTSSFSNLSHAERNKHLALSVCTMSSSTGGSASLYQQERLTPWRSDMWEQRRERSSPPSITSSVTDVWGFGGGNFDRSYDSASASFHSSSRQPSRERSEHSAANKKPKNRKWKQYIARCFKKSTNDHQPSAPPAREIAPEQKAPVTLYPQAPSFDEHVAGNDEARSRVRKDSCWSDSEMSEKIMVDLQESLELGAQSDNNTYVSKRLPQLPTEDVYSISDDEAGAPEAYMAAIAPLRLKRPVMQREVSSWSFDTVSEASADSWSIHSEDSLNWEDAEIDGGEWSPSDLHVPGGMEFVYNPVVQDVQVRGFHDPTEFPYAPTSPTSPQYKRRPFRDTFGSTTGSKVDL